MRPTATLLVAWVALLLLGAAVLPAVLFACHGPVPEPTAAAHCPLAEAMATDCCVAEGATGSEPSAPRGELPACCYQAPAEPAELPALTAPAADAAPALPAPRLAGEVPSPPTFSTAPSARPAVGPPADLCILHAVFLI